MMSEAPILSVWEDFAPEALGASAEEMLDRLSGPTVFRVRGADRSRCRVVVTLMHGNEPSGVRALYEWLRSDPRPRVDALCIVSSVEAARTPPRFSHRMLPGGADLNRRFCPPFLDREGELAEAILSFIRAAGADAVVDLHNNTGHNPPYAIATRIDPQRLALAALFAERLVLSDLRLGALMEALEADLPSVTVECGRAGDPWADRVALEGIRRFFALERLEPNDALASRVEILESPIRVCLNEGVRLSVGDLADDSADVTIAANLDRHNFASLEAGTRLGWVDSSSGWPIVATDATGRDRSAELFAIVDGELRSRGTWIPIMMTTDPAIAAQDCLFYIVRPRPW
jgi:hypothetical protein